MKTLAVIVHYNTPEYTDQLFEMLCPYQKDDYDLIVIDNGSNKNQLSKYTTHSIEINVKFGGAMNVAFNYFIENKQYDSLLFLSNDLIVHGQNFVKTLKKELINFDIISPCIIQPEQSQVHWKQMLNWGEKKIREVKWVDLPCPIFSRRFVEKIKYIDDLLSFGWGPEIFFGIICDKENWKIGVCDFVPVIHIVAATAKKNNNLNEYCSNAEIGQWEFFKKENLVKEAVEFRTWAENYKI